MTSRLTAFNRPPPDDTRQTLRRNRKSFGSSRRGQGLAGRAIGGGRHDASNGRRAIARRGAPVALSASRGSAQGGRRAVAARLAGRAVAELSRSAPARLSSSAPSVFGRGLSESASSPLRPVCPGIPAGEQQAGRSPTMPERRRLVRPSSSPSARLPFSLFEHRTRKRTVCVLVPYGMAEVRFLREIPVTSASNRKQASSWLGRLRQR